MVALFGDIFDSFRLRPMSLQYRLVRNSFGLFGAHCGGLHHEKNRFFDGGSAYAITGLEPDGIAERQPR